MAKTPSELLKKKIIQYKKECQNILQLSNSIRYVGVINAYGKTLSGIVREDTKPLLKSEEAKNEFFIISTLMTLRKNMTNSMGNLDYILLQHQKVCLLIFQKQMVTYYISIDRAEKNIDKIIKFVQKAI